MIATQPCKALMRSLTFQYPSLHTISASALSTTIRHNSSIFRKTPKTTRLTNSQLLRRTKGITWLRNNESQILESIQKEHPILPVTTFTTCEKYDFDSILQKTNVGVKILIPNEILHFVYEGKHDVLLLESGSIVGWGVDEETVEHKILPLFKDCMISKYDQFESEDMDYIEINGESSDESHVITETIIINGADRQQSLFDKAAFSSGLSRSTRLAILENALEKHILQTRKVTEGLSVGKKLSVTEKDLLRSTGRLFLLRGKLNLYSELIEIPDLYWTEPNLERIYRNISNILDISPRISILNKKLDYATDESRALLQTLNEEKGTRLEWIIIILIMIEVCFETFHFYERYWDEKKMKEIRET